MKINKHKLNDLENKTIKSVIQMKGRDTDDIGYLKFTFTDDSFIVIEALYGMWTGKSYGEYPTGLNLLEINLQELEPIK